MRSIPHHSNYPLEWLVSMKNARSISVCIPARNEARTIGPIVRAVSSELVSATGLVDEIVVVDDGSCDATASVARDAGARVVLAQSGPSGPAPSSASSPRSRGQAGPDGCGKGSAMWTAMLESTGDILVFCDADIVDFDIRFVTGLLGPLLEEEDASLVKGSYRRPLGAEGTGGGRVTELMARPLIQLLFPHLAFVRQPLAGETAARREILEQVPFSKGYGVEIALLIDVAKLCGPSSIAQVDLDVRTHRNRSLEELSLQATEVLLAALSRCPQSAVQRGASVHANADPLPILADFPGYWRKRVQAR
ncbi:MAG: glucosyl-3-phosphoglycerate synthase [Acidimicrobiales bacterium]